MSVLLCPYLKLDVYQIIIMTFMRVRVKYRNIMNMLNIILALKIGNIESIFFKKIYIILEMERQCVSAGTGYW